MSNSIVMHPVERGLSTPFWTGWSISLGLN
jgi:hypothetical protein